MRSRPAFDYFSRELTISEFSRPTAFVSHFDCSRHDTGWNHPDHQGRLPAVMRAVNRDMIALLERVLEIEGRHATRDELLLVHTEEYLAQVEGWALEAAEAGKSLEVAPGVMVSDASWDAARAAAGSALTAIDAVMDRQAVNAFCPVRPPGAQAGVDQPGGFGLLNSVAIAARYLARSHGIDSIVLIEWSSTADSALASLFANDPKVHVGTLGTALEGRPPPSAYRRTLLPGMGGDDFCSELNELVDEMETSIKPSFILLAVGLDVLKGDPVGSLEVAPEDLHHATRILMDWADDACGGRIVSVLEGGYEASALGAGAVQHLRALTGQGAL